MPKASPVDVKHVWSWVFLSMSGVWRNWVKCLQNGDDNFYGHVYSYVDNKPDSPLLECNTGIIGSCFFFSRIWWYRNIGISLFMRKWKCKVEGNLSNTTQMISGEFDLTPDPPEHKPGLSLYHLASLEIALSEWRYWKQGHSHPAPATPGSASHSKSFTRAQSLNASSISYLSPPPFYFL